MSSNAIEPAHPKPRRRWFSISLSTLLLMVTAFGVWLGFRVNRAFHQKKAVARLYELGGFGSYDYQLADGRVDDDETDEPPGPAWFTNLVGLDFRCKFELAILGARPAAKDDDLAMLENLPLTGFYLGDQTDITDQGFEHVGDLRSLKNLTVRNLPRVTDAGLVHLRGLSKLTGLSLMGTAIDGSGLDKIEHLPIEALSLTGDRVTNGSLAHLKGFRRLKWLHLEGTQITNDAIPYLMELEQVERLFIRSDFVTDDGLKHFRSLPNLRHLEISCTSISPQGAERLKAIFPAAYIDFKRADVLPGGEIEVAR
jgi:hypothetical protein